MSPANCGMTGPRSTRCARRFPPAPFREHRKFVRCRSSRNWRKRNAAVTPAPSVTSASTVRSIAASRSARSCSRADALTFKQAQALSPTPIQARNTKRRAAKPPRCSKRSGGRTQSSMLLVIDNYDSFTYNLVQYFGELGCDVVVKRNDEISLEEVHSLQPERICISPGPGRPADTGISSEVVRELGPKVPLLGVCLGHQCIAAAFGCEIVRAPRLMHGKTSPIQHNNRGVF